MSVGGGIASIAFIHADALHHLQMLDCCTLSELLSPNSFRALSAGSVHPSCPSVTAVNNVYTVVSTVSNYPLYLHSLLTVMEGLHPPKRGVNVTGAIFALAIASLDVARFGSVLSLSVKFVTHFIAF